MGAYEFQPEAWAVTEDRYSPTLNDFMETIFFVGNGYIGLRGTPEEGVGPDTRSMPINYLAPIYDLIHANVDRHIQVEDTRCSVSVPCPNWYPLTIALNGVHFTPWSGTVLAYRRTFDLRTATVTRLVTWRDEHGHETDLAFTRFVSMADRHLAVITVEITPRNWEGPLAISTVIDATIAREQAVQSTGQLGESGAYLVSRTHVTQFDTATAMSVHLCDGQGQTAPCTYTADERIVTLACTTTARRDETCRFAKYVAVCTSRGEGDAPAQARARGLVQQAATLGVAELHAAHVTAVARIWEEGDVVIEGDLASQQGVRFCILQMNQNYAGDNPRVNMAAKGLSGPGYGGLYWWDSETYMLSFFLYTAPKKARNLVLYRYLTLEGARNKAKRYGYRGAMFPWVTIDGEERSADWEYGMLEQHVTAAVAYAVRHYVEATGDEQFAWDYGVEILVETSRFWASRVTYSERKGRYVINKVTGPDEYAVDVNNNCYTNYLAMANLEYGITMVRRMQVEHPAAWASLAARLGYVGDELSRWQDVAARMYIPYDDTLGIHEQDDNFLDRDPVVWREVPQSDRPASRWHWDRLMRSQAIKQADVLLLMYLMHDRFDRETKKRDYLYYEPKTTHESSLSPCVHAIIAAEVGLPQDAITYYLRTARLDLDDVNGNAHEGLHIANTGGSWLCVLAAFAGMRQLDGELRFTPHLPATWQRLAFAMMFRGRRLRISLTHTGMTVTLLAGDPLTVWIDGKAMNITYAVGADDPDAMHLAR